MRNGPLFQFVSPIQESFVSYLYRVSTTRGKKGTEAEFFDSVQSSIDVMGYRFINNFVDILYSYNI
jgi:hypothetical protein